MAIEYYLFDSERREALELGRGPWCAFWHVLESGPTPERVREWVFEHWDGQDEPQAAEAIAKCVSEFVEGRAKIGLVGDSEDLPWCNDLDNEWWQVDSRHPEDRHQLTRLFPVDHYL